MLEANQTPSALKRFTWEKSKQIANTVLETLIWFFAALTLLQNIYLRHQIRGLRETQATMVPKALYINAVAPPIDIGWRLQSIAGETLDGKFRELELAHGRSLGTVIITFSPGCSNCLPNQYGWAGLVEGLKNRNWQVIWVSRDPVDITLRYCKLHGIDSSNVFANPTYPTYLRLGLAAVPNTVVLDPMATSNVSGQGSLTKTPGVNCLILSS